MKFAVINDQVYVGNCNLNSKDQLDIMISCNHRKLADFFVKLSQDIATAGGNVKKALSEKDTQFTIQNNATLLLDAGIPNQSLIMDAALKAIDTSKKSIFITTQFFVNKVIAAHLLLAERRGVQVTIIYNNIKSHHPLEKIMVSSILLREKRRLPDTFFQNILGKDAVYLHAKLLIADDTLFVGSHNYFPLLVHFGTAELCLRIENQKIAQHAKTTLLKQLSGHLTASSEVWNS